MNNVEYTGDVLYIKKGNNDTNISEVKLEWDKFTCSSGSDEVIDDENQVTKQQLQLNIKSENANEICFSGSDKLTDDLIQPTEHQIDVNIKSQDTKVFNNETSELLMLNKDDNFDELELKPIIANTTSESINLYESNNGECSIGMVCGDPNDKQVEVKPDILITKLHEEGTSSETDSADEVSDSAFLSAVNTYNMDEHLQNNYNITHKNYNLNSDFAHCLTSITNENTTCSSTDYNKLSEITCLREQKYKEIMDILDNSGKISICDKTSIQTAPSIEDKINRLKPGHSWNNNSHSKKPVLTYNWTTQFTCPKCKRRFHNRVMHSYHVKKCCNLNHCLTEVYSYKDNDKPDPGQNSSIKCIDGVFKCEQCGKCLKSRTGILAHYQGHKGKKQFQCHRCGKLYTHKQSLQAHQRKFHDKKEVQEEHTDNNYTLNPELT